MLPLIVEGPELGAVLRGRGRTALAESLEAGGDLVEEEAVVPRVDRAVGRHRQAVVADELSLQRRGAVSGVAAGRIDGLPADGRHAAVRDLENQLRGA